MESLNGRLWTNDFRVYYDATHDFFAGNNPYKHNYGLDTGHFKYPPFTLYLFSPQLLFSFKTGQIIHILLSSFAFMYSVMNMRMLTERFPLFGSRKVSYGMLYLLFACVVIHITREMHLGNINLLLLLFFNLGLRALLNNKEIPLVIYWSLMIVLKPIMILVLLPLIFNKRVKTIMLMTSLGIFFFLVPAFHLGFKENWILWTDWFKSIAAHGEYLTSFNTVGSLVSIHTGFPAGWLVSLLCLLLLATLMVNDIYRLKKTASEISLIWSVIFAAFIPNFFITDTEHFLLSLPLIWLLFAALINRGKWYHWAGFFTGMLLFSFNSSDLLGNLSDFVFDHGFLGLGNLVFITTFLMVRNRVAL
ncbi:glycosyltransferase 87 family protein [Fluviicola sp.]|jgi:hypothetical protein|uniref:glycosyltransferase 87 family protein n=1 Tax=Fluviicola sp. TaxID=1917219 RepID=UPI00282B6D01|nr:glycosyltransferase 87 family protein [Fluviicola sp.]MDR0802768.1 glycosyltransferase 87 family protein [Fluviicola sp.]